MHTNSQASVKLNKLEEITHRDMHRMKKNRLNKQETRKFCQMQPGVGRETDRERCREVVVVVVG